VTPAPDRRRDPLLWIALGVAFSPALVDLVTSLGATDRWWGVVWAPLLLAAALLRVPARPSPPRRDGLVGLALGALLECVGLLGGSGTLARLGLPVAVTGLARWLGRPSLGVAALAFFAVPPPTSFGSALTPAPESALARAAAWVVTACGGELAANGPLLHTPTHRLELFSSDTGLAVAVELAAFGWYSALRQAAAAPAPALRAVAWSALVVVVQPAAVGVAVALLLAGAPRLARGWLDWGLVAVTALFAFTAIERRAGDRR
jgi:hypothetical protein